MTPRTDENAAQKTFIRLTALCTMAYFASYISRINLSACMVEMVRAGFGPRNAIALALSVSAVTYGFGQIASGYLSDKCKPQNVMLSGFILTGAMNIMVYFLKDSRFLALLWGINGFAQALMWPPIVAVMTRHLSGERYNTTCMWVGWGAAFGTMAVYGVSPLIIGVGGYRWVFMLCGLLAFIMAAVWKCGYERTIKDGAGDIAAMGGRPENSRSMRFGASAVFVIAMIMLAIVLQGALRDGVSNWMPTFVSENFGLGSSVAILTGVLLPVFHIICSKVVSANCHRFAGNDTAYAGLLFAVGMASALLLALFCKSGVVVSGVLTAFLVGCMHGVNYVLVSMLPLYFSGYRHVSLISGMLNCCTYVGSAVSTYVISIFSDTYGWRSTILLWAVIALCGMLICLGVARGWRRFARQ
jgi:sugar phosphate permease